MTSTLLKSLADEAHIWIAFVRDHAASAVATHYMSYLSDDEKAKLAKFRFYRDRISYLVCHALLRSTLSRYVDIPPDQWLFSNHYHGRPSINPSQCNAQIDFNISRTKYVSVCLITSSVEGGIDVECGDNLSELQLLIKSVLTPQERKNLRGVCMEVLHKRFLKYWTLKEAYLKALGLGLTIPMTQISFALQHNDNTHINILSHDSCKLPGWQFAVNILPNNHVLSVALRKGEHTDWRIKMNIVDPGLSSYSSFQSLPANSDDKTLL